MNQIVSNEILKETEKPEIVNDDEAVCNGITNLEDEDSREIDNRGPDTVNVSPFFFLKQLFLN